MDGAEPQDEQGLRAATRNRRDAPLRSNEPPDGQKIGSFMRLFRQFLIAVCNDIDPLPLCPLMCSLANNLGFLHFALTSIIRGGGSTAMTTAVKKRRRYFSASRFTSISRRRAFSDCHPNHCGGRSKNS